MGIHYSPTYNQNKKNYNLILKSIHKKNITKQKTILSLTMRIKSYLYILFFLYTPLIVFAVCQIINLNNVFSLENFESTKWLFVKFLLLMGIIIIFYTYGRTIGWNKIESFCREKLILSISMLIIAFSYFFWKISSAFYIPLFICVILWYCFLILADRKGIREILLALFFGIFLTTIGGNQQVTSIDEFTEFFASYWTINKDNLKNKICQEINKMKNAKINISVLQEVEKSLSETFGKEYYFILAYYEKAQNIAYLIEQGKIEPIDTSYMNVLDNVFHNGKETQCKNLRDLSDVGCIGDFMAKVEDSNHWVLFFDIRNTFEISFLDSLKPYVDGIAIYCSNVLVKRVGNAFYPNTLTKENIKNLQTGKMGFTKNKIITTNQTIFAFAFPGSALFYNVGSASIIFLAIIYLLKTPAILNFVINIRKKMKSIGGRIEISTFIGYTSLALVIGVIFILYIKDKWEVSQQMILNDIAKIQEEIKRRQHIRMYQISEEIDIGKEKIFKIIPPAGMPPLYQSIFNKLLEESEIYIEDNINYYSIVMIGEEKALIELPKNQYWRGFLKEILYSGDKFITIAAALTFIFFLLGYYKDKISLFPLEFLRKELEKVSQGIKYHISYFNDDEIGQIVNLYNQAIDTIKEAEKEKVWQQSTKELLHEIMNCITPLSMKLQKFYLTNSEDPQVVKNEKDNLLMLTRESLTTLINIVNNFRQYGKLFIESKSKVDVIKIIKDVIEIFKGESYIEFKFYSEPLFVLGIPEQLKVIFTNLIKNAVEAIKDVPQPLITITVTNNTGNCEVVISDNGPGIPKNIQNKIFSPGFSTKKEGSGQGLFITKKIVESLGGKISFSTSTNGTTFTVSLPIASRYNL